MHSNDDEEAHPMTDPAAVPERHTCPWCSAALAADVVRCPSCGAAVREILPMAELVIPGLTAVDPALSHVAGRPLHIPGPSPTQGIAGGAIMAAAAGGPTGLAALGGLAAMAAVEYLGAGAHNGKPIDPEAVGRLPAYVREALEREARDVGQDVTRPDTNSGQEDQGSPSR
jgi:hypothetical protein